MRNREPKPGARRLSDVRSSTARQEVVVGGAEEIAAPGLQPTFQSFYQETFPTVARALGVTLNDSDLGTEATAEAMARAYARWAKVGNYDNPAGWVYRVGMNWALSLRRKLRRRPPATPSTAVDLGPITDPAIHDALMALTVELRAVVVCRLLLDWSTERSADVLGIPAGTVKSRLHRAMGELESRLRSYEDEGE